MKGMLRSVLLVVMSLLLWGSCELLDPLARKDRQIQDDFQKSEQAIRVGIGTPGTPPTTYMLIKGDEAWNGYILRFDLNEEEELVVTSITDIAPTQGWEELEFILQDLQLLELRDQTEIASYPDYPPGNRATHYLFRVKDMNDDRYFRYTNPEDAMPYSWEAQSVVIFSTYLTNEFQKVE